MVYSAFLSWIEAQRTVDLYTWANLWGGIFWVPRKNTAVGFFCKGPVTHTRAASILPILIAQTLWERPQHTLKLAGKHMRFMTNNSISNFICLLASELGFMFSVLPLQLETFSPFFFFVLVVSCFNNEIWDSGYTPDFSVEWFERIQNK